VVGGGDSSMLKLITFEGAQGKLVILSPISCAVVKLSFSLFGYKARICLAALCFMLPQKITATIQS